MRTTRVVGGKGVPVALGLSLFTVMALQFLFVSALALAADDSVCARVQIEIQQELTLERQAFDAHMRIHNGLERVNLENVAVEVTFADAEGHTVRATSDPNDSTALFFIRLNSLNNIQNVDGLGTVAAASVADIHWLIIPAPGASNGVPAGTLYSVGATLAYTIGGDPHTTVVTPDYIYVKPMPEMTLDYFLPGEIFGDDAWTPEREPPVPFSLGVRVKNSGFGTAKGLKIDSAQPKIVDNAQGLPVAFAIVGSEVNGRGISPSLLVNFGDIAPESSGMARWILTCTLSGRFVEFRAEFSHSDELGGELTSLIDAVNTHTLVRDVLVDLPGRDGVRDFLAQDGGVFRVYESQSVDTVVLDQSSAARLEWLSGSGITETYRFTAPPTAGFMLVGLPDPGNGQKVLKQVVRSDGKLIRAENVWLSKTRGVNHSWEYRLNLFDVNTPGAYTVTFIDAAGTNHAPVLEPISEQHGVEGAPLAFAVRASDPDGSKPRLAAAPLPALATFTDQGDGSGVFSWTPAAGQAGSYQLLLAASDGALSTSQRASITICTPADSDCDGMLDAWELAHFGTFARNGAGDFDGDGVSDLQEYLQHTDPTRSTAPDAPVIAAPLDGGEVATLSPDLTITNSTDPDGDPVSFAFELYADSALTQLVGAASNLQGGSLTTSWMVPRELDENHTYTWRVRATDGKGFSEWVYGHFLVNVENDPPGTLRPSEPQDHGEVAGIHPVLRVTNSIDPDDTELRYSFEVYADAALSELVAEAHDLHAGPDGATSWAVTAALHDNTSYHWRARVSDPHGAMAETDPAAFFVNTANDPPEPPAIVSPAPGTEVAVQSLDLVVENAVDVDGDPLSYIFELDRVNTFDSANKTTSGPLPEGFLTTGWKRADLRDNTRCFWRVKVSDGTAESPWVMGSFFVNTANDPPSTPTLKNPGHGTWVTTLTPTLELNASTDPDEDALSYRFELYGDQGLTEPVASGRSNGASWLTPLTLTDNTWYFWRAKAVDEHGAESGWMAASPFMVNQNGIDDPPLITLLEPATDLYLRSGTVPLSWEDSDPDSNAEITLSYAPVGGGAAATVIAADLAEDPDGPDDTYAWEVGSLPEGAYRITAAIADATSINSNTAPGTVTIDRTAPTVQAAPQGGTYSAAQTVTLTANEAATTYYTQDGSIPTTGSPQYSAPIVVNQTTTVTFFAVDRAGNASSLQTQIYTISAATQYWLFGYGHNHPQPQGYKAQFSFLASGPSHPGGWLIYACSKARVDLVSTRITSVTVAGHTATIAGTGWVGGVPGYTFTATVTNGNPERFAITIYKPNGNLYYRAATTRLDSGEVFVVPLP